MRRWVCGTVFVTALPVLAAAAEPTVHVELNAAEAADNRCRLTFVLRNEGKALDTLKLDLVVFDRNRRVHRRLIAEMAPLRAAKTSVKTYAVDGACDEIRSVLVNDVAACAPVAGDCLELLSLSSRVEGAALFK